MLIMKKISLLAIGLITTVFSFSQTPAKFGIKGGLNIASLKIEDFDNTDSRLGLHAGLLAHIHLAPQWAVQPEVLYSAEGGKVDFGGGSEATYKNDYVNIPVMLQYMFDNGFRIEAGPQLGLLVSSKIEDENDDEADAKDTFKSTNVSVGLGLNYLSYSGFGIGGRYNLGVSNIAEGSGDVKSRVFQISLFYMFDSMHKAKSK
jgi:hypothetical protein